MRPASVLIVPRLMVAAALVASVLAGLIVAPADPANAAITNMRAALQVVLNCGPLPR